MQKELLPFASGDCVNLAGDEKDEISRQAKSKKIDGGFSPSFLCNKERQSKRVEKNLFFKGKYKPSKKRDWESKGKTNAVVTP
jgi:hypothetical protein